MHKWIESELFNFILNYYEKTKKLPKVFLSGAITERITTYKKYFREAEQLFEEIGVEVYNPSEIDVKTPWDDAMEKTISELSSCDFMYILKNWENSKGVKIEIDKAKELNIPVFCQ
ncbi:DUF4406 domain-containing protein [Peptoniphilus sp. AGMB00490]|uniref:DUF4406 domain-containing protein n=1 Tax=Peptoniphilus faecalis TaxID=2731255 RepID=A0A848RH12_9FIRM|nr:DUF4406 domain-containing protein [Peptoniphilus faecalis]NMW84719.1 DUF4406 domain-containing protein [Peptoniphilus faecalis]